MKLKHCILWKVGNVAAIIAAHHRTVFFIVIIVHQQLDEQLQELL